MKNYSVNVKRKRRYPRSKASSKEMLQVKKKMTLPEIYEMSSILTKS